MRIAATSTPSAGFGGVVTVSRPIGGNRSVVCQIAAIATSLGLATTTRTRTRTQCPPTAHGSAAQPLVAHDNPAHDRSRDVCTAAQQFGPDAAPQNRDQGCPHALTWVGPFLCASPSHPCQDGWMGFFRYREAAWIARLGNLRNTIRQEIIGRHLDVHIAAGATVLDVGCGQGTQSLRLMGRGCVVTGVEPSSDLLARFRNDASDAGVSPELVQGEIDELDALLARRTFDAVCAHGLLMYLDDPGKAIAQLTERVAPNGMLSITFKNAHGLQCDRRCGSNGVKRSLPSARPNTQTNSASTLAPTGWMKSRAFFNVWVSGSTPGTESASSTMRSAATSTHQRAAFSKMS